MELPHQRLGLYVTMSEIANLGTEHMLQYDPYEYESQNVEIFPNWMKNQRIHQNEGTSM